VAQSFEKLSLGLDFTEHVAIVTHVVVVVDSKSSLYDPPGFPLSIAHDETNLEAGTRERTDR
jgi:hypothetical protein